MSTYVMLPPDVMVRQYRRFIRRLCAELETETLRVTRVSLRRDDIEDDIENEDRITELETALAALLLWWQRRKYTAAATVNQIFSSINKFNDNEFRKMIKKLSGLTIPPARSLPQKFGELVSPQMDIERVFGPGVDSSRAESFMPVVEGSWKVNQNEALDKNITGAIGDTGSIIRTGIVSGVAAKLIVEKLKQSVTGLMNRLERFVIRQVTEIDTQLQEYRQKSFRGKSYRWQTRGDMLVRGTPGGKYPKARPSHYHRQGMIFQWANPPEGGNPGRAEGCRCSAVMVLPS